MSDSTPLRPGLTRDEFEHCATCGKPRAEHDAVPWVHAWLPRRYVRDVHESVVSEGGRIEP